MTNTSVSIRSALWSLRCVHTTPPHQAMCDQPNDITKSLDVLDSDHPSHDALGVASGTRSTAVLAVPDKWRAYSAELLGTFLLVFFGLASNWWVVRLVHWSYMWSDAKPSAARHAGRQQLPGAAHRVGRGLASRHSSHGRSIRRAPKPRRDARRCAMPPLPAQTHPTLCHGTAAGRPPSWHHVPGSLLGAVQHVRGFARASLNGDHHSHRVHAYHLAAAVAVEHRCAARTQLARRAAADVTGGFFNEAVGTALLMVAILATAKPQIPLHVRAVLLSGAFVAVSGAIGLQTGFALNPARDLGPRIACAIFGYPATIWTERDGYFVYGPIVGPIVGAVVGAGVHDLLVGDGIQLAR